MTRFWLMVLALILWGAPAQAHKPSDSYLTLTVTAQGLEGQWDVALRDLDFAIGLDGDDDGKLTWREIRTRRGEIEAYLLSRLAVGMGSAACELRPTELLLDEHTDGRYAVVRFAGECLHPTFRMDVSYKLFFDLDPQHRGLARIVSAGAVTSVIFSPDHAQETVTVGASQHWGTLLSYAHEGVHHIWSGIDHLLFLVALLLPAVLRRTEGTWQAASGFRAVLMDVAGVVTAFTVAHSITLSLSALQMVALPSRWVETTIALSVGVAACNNLLPFARERRWLVAFAFGLLHGFGLAGALSDLGLVEGAQVLALGGFNLGVEAGQLAVVALFLPVAYLARHRWLYRRVVLTGGSLAIVGLSICWALERIFDLQILWF